MLGISCHGILLFWIGLFPDTMAPDPPFWDIHDGSGANFRWC